MSHDISHILDGWPYQSGQVTARKILGDDGREKIQLRLDLGVLQMETTGRPDGARPNGHESLLDWHEHRLERHRRLTGSDDGFQIDGEQCDALRAEGLMYYHRYLAEFVLGDYRAVERDAARNLRLTDFCLRYAAEEDDREFLEQYRSYVLMTVARARAHRQLEADRPKGALRAVQRGIKEVRDVLRTQGREGDEERSPELAVLRSLAREIEAGMPVDPLEHLRARLADAVEAEHYERAAELRDQIQRLTPKDQPNEEDDRQ